MKRTLCCKRCLVLNKAPRTILGTAGTVLRPESIFSKSNQILCFAKSMTRIFGLFEVIILAMLTQRSRTRVHRRLSPLSALQSENCLLLKSSVQRPRRGHDPAMRLQILGSFCFFCYKSANHYEFHYFALQKTVYRSPTHPPLEIYSMSLLHFPPDSDWWWRRFDISCGS